MTCIFRSNLFRDFESQTKRITRLQSIRIVLGVMLWVVLLLCYVGMLLSPAVACGIVLQALHSFPVAFWVSAGLISVGILWGIYAGGKKFVCCFRQGVIDVELLVGILGFVLAAILITVALLTGFFFGNT